MELNNNHQLLSDKDKKSTKCSVGDYDIFSDDDFKEKILLSPLYSACEFQRITSSGNLEKKKKYYKVASESIERTKNSFACINREEYIEKHPAFKDLTLKLNELQADLVTTNLFSETYHIDIIKLIHHLNPEYLFQPKSIINYLSLWVYGQEEAKEALAITIYKHLVRTGFIGNEKGLKWKSTTKATPIIVGPSGSGKSLMIKVISLILPVPVVTVNVNTITQTGYKGQSFDSCITKLLIEANYKYLNNDDEVENRIDFLISKTEMGIIFVDEFDKIAYRNNQNETIGTIGVQKEILHHIDGKIVEAKSNLDDYASEVRVNTENITYCFSGAFSGIDSIIHSRMNVGVGFRNKNNSNSDTTIQHCDIEKYGIIKELTGRFTEIVKLKSLTKEDLSNILLKSKDNALQKEINTLGILGVRIVMEKSSIEYIAEKATENYGARYLQVLVGKLFNKIYLNIDKYKEREIIFDLKSTMNLLFNTNN